MCIKTDMFFVEVIWDKKISESVRVFRINYLTVMGFTDWQQLIRHGIFRN